MATRYCGDLVVRLAWDDEKGGWPCSIRESNKPGSGVAYRVLVRPPAVLECPVDSARAYDEAARAAVAFMVDDGEKCRRGMSSRTTAAGYTEDGGTEAAYSLMGGECGGDEGYEIRRKRV